MRRETHRTNNSEFWANTFLVDEMSDTEKGYARGPERALMAALLFDGVVGYMQYACSRARLSGAESRYKEAFTWVQRRGGEYVFSFDNVCEGLGINPDGLRYGLLNACNSRAYEWKRARRNF